MLSACALPFLTNFALGGSVMGARKKYDVKYPNLYAVPGVHKHADEFNRVQRGHQSMMETMPNVIVMTLTAGLKFPKITSLFAEGPFAGFCPGWAVYCSCDEHAHRE